MTSLSGFHETVLVVTQDGSISADIRPLVRFNVSVIVTQGERREQGVAGSGGRYGFREFIVKNEASRLAKEAVRQALVNLEAEAAPAGEMVVVLGPGWPGILLHEAIGHGLEGDFNRKGTSAFSGRIGETVASRGVSVVDDGTLKGRRGSLNIDDEGTPTQCTTLIEDGKLQCYMQDRMNASLMGVSPYRQWQKRVLCPFADAQDDEYLYVAWKTVLLRKSLPQSKKACTQLTSAVDK